MDAVILEVVRRRRAAVVSFLVIDILKQKSRKSKRRIWSRSWLQRRDTGRGVLTMLFDELRLEDPMSFVNYTRMSEEELNQLLLLLTPYIQKQNTVMREAISPRDTLSQIVHSTCLAIINVLEDKVIKFPSTIDDWELIAHQFQTNCQFPHSIGALDGKHIVFRPPRKEGSIYRNYKSTDSIVLLALVDAEYKFIFVDIGRNGRMHDSAVFRDSPLRIKLKSNSLNLPQPGYLPGFGHKMPYTIVANDAFSLHESLMKPYPDRGLTPEKRIFNYRLSRARRMVEDAFGILANRFRVLLNPISLSVEKVEVISYTCVLLHNFLLLKKSQWYIPSQYRGEISGNLDSGLRSISNQGGNRCTSTAIAVREYFTEYFNTVGAVTWQCDAVARGNF